MNRSVIPLLFVSFLVTIAPVAHTADCENYGDYVHWVGGLERHGTAYKVAVAGSTVCLVAGTLRIVDASDPRDLRLLSTVEIPGGLWDVAVADSRALVTAGSDLVIVDLADLGAPKIVGKLTLGSPGGLTAVGSLVYVTSSTGLLVVDVTDPHLPRLVGSVATPEAGQDVAVAGSHAYVVCGGAGLQVVDVAEPGAPKLVGGVATMGLARGVAVAGEYVCVGTAANGDGTSSGVQTIDVTVPSQPHVAGSVVTPAGVLGVAVQGERAFAACHTAGVCVVDIGDPAAPRIATTVDTRTVFDVAAAGGLVYAGADASNLSSYWMLHAIEVGNGEGAPVVGSLALPDEAYGLALAGSHAFVAARTAGLQIVDVVDPVAPQIVASLDELFWALGVAVHGDYAYVTAGYGPRYLAVVSITDPAHPQVLGEVTLFGWAWGVAFAGDYAYVADAEAGLDVVDVSNPWAPHLVGNVDTPLSARGVAVVGEYAYVADAAGLQIVDISVPSQPWIVGNLSTGAAGVACQDNRVYVTGDLGVQIVDVTDPAWPEVVGEVLTPTPAKGVAVAGSNLYVGTAGWSFVPSALQVIDVLDPTRPRLVGSVGRASVVAIGDDRVYAADSGCSFQITAIQCEPTPVLSEEPHIPGIRLQAYPNPAPGRVTIRLMSSLVGPAVATIYDAAGRRVRSLPDVAPGRATGDLFWDGHDEGGRPVSAGVYFARVRSGGKSGVVRLMLVR